MCIFAGEVEAVYGTKIFASTNPDGSKQFTAYEMNVDLAKGPAPTIQGEPSSRDPKDPWANQRTKTGFASTAMILPVPIAAATEIELVDMSSVPTFFDTLNVPFQRQTRSMSFANGPMALSALPVYDVGDYKVSVAYSLADIDRADPTVFQLEPNVARVLTAYGSGFAFIIASLKNSGKISPLGYISTIPQDGRSTAYPMFIPTLHEHGGSVDWDHRIYVGGPGRFQQLPSDDNYAEGENLTSSLASYLVEKVPQLEPFLKEGPITRLTAEGALRNMDLRAGV